MSGCDCQLRHEQGIQGRLGQTHLLEADMHSWVGLRSDNVSGTDGGKDGADSNEMSKSLHAMSNDHNERLTISGYIGVSGSHASAT